MLNTDSSSSSRPSRLRGISYLRTHLHSSSSSPASPPQHSSSSSYSNRPQFGRQESFPALSSGPTSPRAQSPPRIAASRQEESFAPRRRSSLGDSSPSTNRVARTRSRSSTNPLIMASDVASASPTSATAPVAAAVVPLTAATTTPTNDAQQSTSPTATSHPPPPPPQHSSLPSIQLIPHQDPRVTRPSLAFTAITRTLPGDSSILRVGRYSEKDTPMENTPTGPSDAPVGFKSKVVSRRHCEFFYSNAQWYVKDVKSSSGTFLNHIRLSQPGVESKPFPVNDGDIVQLGIDFKGGEEMIFRCVKIRVALNRGWQKELNTFNKSAIKRLREMAKSGDAGSKNSTECTICLSPIAPIQALFVAPCSHTWHYKCIRTILNGTSYPQFICPNCRAVTDLNADVDIDFDEWEASDDEADEKKPDDSAPADDMAKLTVDDTLTAATMPPTTTPRTIAAVGPASSALAMNIPMPAGFSTGRRAEGTGVSQEDIEAAGPMTPLNNAGPFVYD